MPQPTLAQLGAAIRELREERALTIETLADEAGLHAVSVSRIETGNQNPTWTALTGIAVALEVNVGEIVQRAGGRQGREG